YFRKEIAVKYRVVSAKLYGTCDNSMTVYINGKEVISSENWEAPVFREVTSHFISPASVGQPARNVVSVKARNKDGKAGLLLRILLENPKKGVVDLVTDSSWRVSDQTVKGWTEVD